MSQRDLAACPLHCLLVLCRDKPRGFAVHSACVNVLCLLHFTESIQRDILGWFKQWDVLLTHGSIYNWSGELWMSPHGPRKLFLEGTYTATCSIWLQVIWHIPVAGRKRLQSTPIYPKGGDNRHLAKFRVNTSIHWYYAWLNNYRPQSRLSG